MMLCRHFTLLIIKNGTLRDRGRDSRVVSVSHLNAKGAKFKCRMGTVNLVMEFVNIYYI